MHTRARAPITPHEAPEYRRHPEALLKNAKTLRADMTEAEKLLWSVLSRRQAGHSFRKQHPIGSFIVDFICIQQQLIIELDGGQHTEHTAYDDARTKKLNQLGYRVLRFWNNEVMENLTGVYEVIIDALHHPNSKAGTGKEFPLLGSNQSMGKEFPPPERGRQGGGQSPLASTSENTLTHPLQNITHPLPTLPLSGGGLLPPEPAD